MPIWMRGIERSQGSRRGVFLGQVKGGDEELLMAI